MRVIGTAGHVDHGKSTLVRRLTGIDPDRLAEEQARQLTIDLGFAWMSLSDGEMVGIVDVPGHRDFIENMLAGVGSIDAALLVIAADEGVMPQTREHLAILDLLAIKNGLVVLSKLDMVDDPDWVELVEQDIRETLAHTRLANVPIVRVSAHNGTGIPQLKAHVEHLLADLPPQTDYNQPRLSVDRVFTISGFGTVVTGTLLGGRLRMGDAIELQPGDINGRVRGLQSYKQNVEVAYPGSRVAVNISGVNKTDVQRGQLLTFLDQVTPTTLVDVYFQHLPDAQRPLKHNAEVKVFCGAAEALANVRLLNDEVLAPGSEGWLQLRLSDPLPLVRGDRYILRYPSPAQTIGGGIVVNPTPQRRWKRFQTKVIQNLVMLMQGTPGQRVAQAAEGAEPIKRPHLQKQVGYNDAELETAIQEALTEGWLIDLDNGLYMAMLSYQNIVNAITDTLRQFHTDNPLRLGMQREELRSRLNIKNNTLSLIIDRLPEVVAEADLLRLANHSVTFTAQQQATIEKLASAFQQAPYTPPTVSEAVEIVGEDVLHALIDLGDLVQVQPDVIFSHAAYQEMVNGILEIIDAEGNVDAKGLRDRFNTSRKYAIALLEHLDHIGMTRRTGDVRIRGKNAPR